MHNQTQMSTIMQSKDETHLIVKRNLTENHADIVSQLNINHSKLNKFQINNVELDTHQFILVLSVFNTLIVKLVIKIYRNFSMHKLCQFYLYKLFLGM